MAPAAARPEVCVGAIVVQGDQLLMVRRGRGPAQGQWSVPGGRVERGETLAEAVVRELWEETHVAGVCGALMGWVERISEDAHHVILDFAVVPLEDTDPVAGDDAAEASWVPLEGVADLDLVEGLAEFLADQGVIDLLA
ncbi:MAG: NUDIX hydrolase [Acidimicrobiales bacterium]